MAFSCSDLRVPPQPPRRRRPPGSLRLGPFSFYGDEKWPEETVRFRFRTRNITAIATRVNHVHPNVLRLKLQPSVTDSIIQTILGYLPPVIRSRFESAIPEWTIPSQLIVKKVKEKWGEEFNREKAAYAQLEPLQGIVIPKLFGEVRYENTRALLLSDIGGACLAMPEGGLLELDDLRRLLNEAFAAFVPFRILQQDSKLDSFHLIGDRIMCVDLEILGQEPLSDEDLYANIKCEVNHLVKCYEEHQDCLWKDGYITIAT